MYKHKQWQPLTLDFKFKAQKLEVHTVQSQKTVFKLNKNSLILKFEASDCKIL